MTKWKSFILFIVLSAFLSGCSVTGSDKNKNTEVNSPSTPEETVYVAFEALKELDFETFNLYTTVKGGGTATGHQDKELLDELFSNFSYEIGDIQIDGDTAVVNVTITNTDFSEVVSQLVAKSIYKAFNDTNEGETEEELFVRLISEANQAQKLITSDLALSLKNKNKEWTITLNGETLDTLCGNLIPFMGF